jgi:hypothetical protein
MKFRFDPLITKQALKDNVSICGKAFIICAGLDVQTAVLNRRCNGINTFGNGVRDIYD